MMQEFLLSWGLPALFLLSFLAATLVPLGSEWLLAVLLTHGYEPSPVVIVATLGNSLGALTTWAIGRWGGDWLMSRLLRTDAAARERAEQRFTRWGSWALLMSWLPIIGDPLCLVAGVMKVSLPRFILLVLTGKLARYAAVAGLVTIL